MTFLNALLALGTLAFTVPLVIHLLFRSKYRVIEWGAMHLLDLNLQVNSRSFEWKNLLLLLLRCLIPIFLALAMARPLMQNWLSSGSGEPISVAIILDDSPSMQTKLVDQQTRWAKALDEIQSLIQSAPNGSQTSIVLGGNPPLLVSERALATTIAEWTTKPSISGRLNIVDATRLALDWLEASASLRRQLIVISDFQANDWTSPTSDLDSVAKMLAEQVVAPKMDWINILGNNPSSNLTNMAVEAISMSPQWVSENQDVAIMTTVRNHSTLDQDNVKLRTEVDGKEIDLQTFRIPSNSSVQIRSRWKSKERGIGLIRSSLSDGDDLTTDNQSWKPFLIHPPIQVLLVDGDPKPGPMESETDFLRVALSPFALSNLGRSDFFRSQVLAPPSWNEETLKGIHVVALCNTNAISEQQQTTLHAFVEKGGGLVVFPGDRVNHDDWNRRKSIKEGGLGTTKLQPRIEVKEPASQDSKISIDPESFRTTMLAELTAASKNSLREVQIKSYAPLNVDTEQTEVIGRLSNGQPWLIRSQVGKGIILVAATSCDERDSNLPSRPVFVPLMQRMFHLAASTKMTDMVFETGEPWTISPPVGWEDKELDIAKLVVRRPNKSDPEIATRTWTTTRDVGLYEAIWSTPDKTDRTTAVFQSSRSAKGEESDSSLRIANETKLQQSAQKCNASMYQNSSDLIASFQSQWKGREIGSWLWVLAILCFLGEMVVEQSFLLGGRRTSPSANAVSPIRQGAR